MTRSTIATLLALLAVTAATVGATPASADHSWGCYHWPTSAGIVAYGLSATSGPLSGIALVQEQPRRACTRIVVADARQQAPVVESIGVKYTLGACGRAAGRGLDVDLRHVEGRGLEYRGLARTAAGRPAITSRARALRVGLDRDGDGAFDEQACGELIRLQSPRGSVYTAVELRPRGSGEISGIAIARERRGRLQVGAVVVDRSLPVAETSIPFEGGFASGACGQAPGRTLPFRLTIDGLAAIKALRTPVRSASQALTRRARSLRLTWADGALCGPRITHDVEFEKWANL